jgi:hypothetical protein
MSTPHPKESHGITRAFVGRLLERFDIDGSICRRDPRVSASKKCDLHHINASLRLNGVPGKEHGYPILRLRVRGRLSNRKYFRMYFPSCALSGPPHARHVIARTFALWVCLDLHEMITRFAVRASEKRKRGRHN